MIPLQEQCSGVAGALANSRTKNKKGTWAELKKRKRTPKQCPSRRRNVMQRMKTQELIHAARVKQKPERVVGLDKLEGNGKHVRVRKTMDSYGSGACTKGLRTTYLYSANIVEIWWWGERGSLFWGSRLSSFGGNVLLGWNFIQKR